MNHWFEMGKYAAYVWPAYGASALGLGAAVAIVWRGYANAVAALAAPERTK